MAKSKVNVYEIVTEQMLDSLKQALKDGKTIPWHKPWRTSAPFNAVSKKEYRGINPFLLAMGNFDDPRWLTFNQASELGYAQWRKREKKGKDTEELRDEYFGPKDSKGRRRGGVENKAGIRKDEKSTVVVFWKPLEIKDPEHPDADEDGKRKIRILRYYRVFNVEQTQGLEFPTLEKDEREIEPIESAQQILDGYVNTDRGPKYKHGGDRAFYRPSEDRIGMPTMKRFDNADAYYTTAFHEATHSTGHDSRLKRKFGESFGNEPYAKEELVAEFGAAMLCAHAGIDPTRDIKNRTAYIQSWMKALNNDEKLAVSAAGQAQKAADLILDIKFEDDNPHKDDGVIATPED